MQVGTLVCDQGDMRVAGAAHVVTSEYRMINSSHPQHSAYHPREQARQFLDGKLQPFDFAFSYSSLEHSGLGRYGAAACGAMCNSGTAASDWQPTGRRSTIQCGLKGLAGPEVTITEAHK